MSYTKPLNLFNRLKTRLVLLILVTVLVFEGPGVTLQVHTEASNTPESTTNNTPDPVSRTTESTAATPLQTQCVAGRGQVGEFDPKGVVHLPTVPVHLSVLPNRKVLFWGRDKTIDASGVHESVGRSFTYTWNMSDGSNKTDFAVWRPSEGNWYIIKSSNGGTRVNQWGLNGDVPVPADYDGDGIADLTVWRPTEGNWYTIKSSTNTTEVRQWGLNGDVPVPADYDGDGKADLAVFRPSTGFWHIIRTTSGPDLSRQLGANGDVPVPKDYDGDYKADIAVYRPSTSSWFIVNSATGGQIGPLQQGTNGDVPVPGDYHGDEHADLALYRPSNGNWTILNRPNGGTRERTLGPSLPTDRPAPADYDGDGKTDLAIFRAAEGNWYILNSSTGQTSVRQWGFSGDIIVPADYDAMRRVTNTNTNLFCSGHSFLPDGRLFVTGGQNHPDADVGERDTNIFDYNNNTWTLGPTMNKGRWYPYNLSLATGETMIMSGSYWSNEPSTPVQAAMNLEPQVANVGATSLRKVMQAPELSYYPYLYQMPDGRVLQIGADFVDPTRPGGPPGPFDQSSRVFNPYANNEFGSWDLFAGGSTLATHGRGTSVMFDSGRQVLLAGGFVQSTDQANPAPVPTNFTEFINLKPPSGQSSSWTAANRMNTVRTFHVATVLPNGKVLVTGGVSCPGGNNINCAAAAAMNPELWDLTHQASSPGQIPFVVSPGSAPWRVMATQKEVRAYHSVAALLPDGKVLIGGGGLPGAIGEADAFGNGITNFRQAEAARFGHKNVEIYSPPYLFDANGCEAPRPMITVRPPASLIYGQTFFVGTSGAGSNPQVSLVRLPSVTHAFNQDQRHTFLSYTFNGSGLNVNAPADSHKVPPGYYMLFVMNSSGVPSIAEIVKIETTPSFEGFVDGSDCNQIWGWAWDRSKPNQPVTVSIFAGGTLLANVRADLFRQDLLNADKGDGKHAFVFNVPESIKNGQAQSISVRIAGTSTQLGFSPRAITCRAKMFPGDVPQTTASGGGSTWEQGVEFSSSTSGKITHIAFWRASSEPMGNHIGRIWTSTGVLLAWAPFNETTTPGWQYAQLSTPVQITAGVRYKVTYNAHSMVAKTFDVFGAGPLNRPPFTIYGSSFCQNAGCFPTTGSTSNLFADILFNSPQ